MLRSPVASRASTRKFPAAQPDPGAAATDYALCASRRGSRRHDHTPGRCHRRAGSSPRDTPRMHRKFPAAQRVPEGSAHTPCNGATRGNRGDAGAASLWNLAWRRRGSQQLEPGRGWVVAPDSPWRAPRAARGRSRSVRPGMETPGTTRPNARQRRRQGCCKPVEPGMDTPRLAAGESWQGPGRGSRQPAAPIGSSCASAKPTQARSLLRREAADTGTQRRCWAHRGCRRGGRTEGMADAEGGLSHPAWAARRLCPRGRRTG